jgi:hypothetical protein
MTILTMTILTTVFPTAKAFKLDNSYGKNHSAVSSIPISQRWQQQKAPSAVASGRGLRLILAELKKIYGNGF